MLAPFLSIFSPFPLYFYKVFFSSFANKSFGAGALFLNLCIPCPSYLNTNSVLFPDRPVCNSFLISILSPFIYDLFQSSSEKLDKIEKKRANDKEEASSIVYILALICQLVDSISQIWEADDIVPFPLATVVWLMYTSHCFLLNICTLCVQYLICSTCIILIDDCLSHWIAFSLQPVLFVRYIYCYFLELTHQNVCKTLHCPEQSVS